ncbi:hypothetical protein BGZ73_003115 [Actinomortierella ambigua]|nr:hypothetical protein BGZ73_003115 [Actinomortierella ambigua]
MSSSQPAQALQFYDIAMRPPTTETCCSPNPWKTRLALNFKKVPYTTTWVALPDVAKVRRGLDMDACRKFADGSDFYTLPVVVDPNTGAKVGDSFDIALYLQEQYPQAGDGDLLPDQELDYEFNHPMAFLVPLSEKRVNTQFDNYARFNMYVDGTFTAHAGLMGYGMPLDPATAEATKAEMVRRAGGYVKSWEEFEIKGEQRTQTWASFKEALGGLAKLYEKDPSGPFLLGQRASYADFIVGGWLRMMYVTLPKHEWEEARNWHGGIFGRLFDGLLQYAEVH